VALVALDIDHFKAVNDRLGHASGDAALRSVAAAIRGTVRPWDPCGRMGGDEFLIALPGVDIARAQRVAARVRAAACDESVEITVSAGIAVFPDHATEQEELMRHADAALYRSKREGRDRTVAYAPAG
jgi:diguanylate cyclase (GGDEF)-like protein